VLRAAALQTSGDIPVLRGGRELLAGEHVRQNVENVRIFSVTNGP
jgi:hypothetical protein